MTNEEKAIIEYPKKQASDVGYYVDVNEQKRQIFIKACEWKDEQFKLYLEKKKIEADKMMRDAYEEGEQWDYYIAEQNKQLFTEIINEQFHKIS